jgi:hypothetical protein
VTEVKVYKHVRGENETMDEFCKRTNTIPWKPGDAGRSKPTKVKESVVETAERVRSEVTAGRKDDIGKLRYDLFPPGPLSLVAEVFTIGAKKYDDRNWEKGIKWGRIFGALMRHAWKWWGGEKNDPVDGQHHLASVAWCCLVLMEYERTHPEMDDRGKL